MGPLSFEQRARQGNCYTVSSPSLTATLTSNISATIQNPSGSGKNIFLYCLEAYIGTTGMFFATVFKFPTTGLPATSSTPVNQNWVSSNTSVAVINYGVSATAMSGGTTLFTLGIPGAARTPYKEELLVIPAGTTIGFNTPILLATNVGFKLDYWEEPNS